jgi:hypothetical protein
LILGSSDGYAQPGIRVWVASQSCSDGKLSYQLCEYLTAFSIDSGFSVFNIGPFGMT